MSFLTHLQCSLCHKILPSDQPQNLCPDCFKPLLAKYDYVNAAKLKRYNLINIKENSIWRYQRLLPVQNKNYVLSLGEGWTPLIKANNLGREFCFQNLFIKDEGNNPTGSFKSRGLSVAVSRAFELGIKNLSIPSAGNAAGALSAYAALAHIQAHVYLPKDVPKPFIAECESFGAQINLVDGLITDCAAKATINLEKYGRFDVSTLKEPYRLEGKKTMGYEIAEQFKWELPEVIIYPTGGGTGLIGMWKAFDEMEKLGWIGSKRPQMVVVQAEKCAPIVKAFYKRTKFSTPWENVQTIADGLRVPSAIGDFLILNILYESDGLAIGVSDEEMLKSAKLIGKSQGLFVSPESGATLAAFHKLLEKKWLSKNDRVVLFSTGSGYKYSHLFI
jgi:threonine synthase